MGYRGQTCSLQTYLTLTQVTSFKAIIRFRTAPSKGTKDYTSFLDHRDILFFLNLLLNPTLIIYVQSLNLYIDDYFQSGRVFAVCCPTLYILLTPYTVDTSTLVLIDEQWEFISSTHARVKGSLCSAISPEHFTGHNTRAISRLTDRRQRGE